MKYRTKGVQASTGGIAFIGTDRCPSCRTAITDGLWFYFGPKNGYGNQTMQECEECHYEIGKKVTHG